MPDYQKMYHLLFNEVTDAITKLQLAQQKTEHLYMGSPEPTLTALSRDAIEKRTNVLSKKEHSPTKDIPPKKKPPSRDER